MEKSIRDLAPTVAVIYFLGVAVPVVMQQGGDLTPFPVENYMAPTAVSGVTTAVSQQLVVMNSTTGQPHIGDMLAPGWSIHHGGRLSPSIIARILRGI
jgi:hypothetical protein